MGKTFLGRLLGRPVNPGSKGTTDPQTVGPEDAESQFQRGNDLAGAGVAGSAPDHPQATEWYLKAAVQGHCGAQFNLGMIYRQGLGVVRNEATSEMWLRKAAMLGHAGAQYYLGVGQHRASKAAGKSEASELRMEALKWLDLAIVPGYPGAESAREFVALGMTREEVGQAERRAAAFTTDLQNHPERVAPPAHASLVSRSA